MKYFSRLLIIVSLVLSFAACNDLLAPDSPKVDEVPFRVSFSMADRVVQTKSKVSGTESPVHMMQLVCFDANGQYLGIRDAEVTSNGASATAPHFSDMGYISGTVPQGTARIHFIANRNLNPSLSHSVGTAESIVMNSPDLSTKFSDNTFVEGDNAYQEVCYWGYHKEDDSEAMSEWLKPASDANPKHVVYMIRDRARVVLTYNSTDQPVGVVVKKIEWLIHNGRERGYLAPAEDNWSNTGYYGNSTVQGYTSELISKAGIHEYTYNNNNDRYSLWRSETDNDDDKFEVAYQSSGTYTAQPQFLFDDNNKEVDKLKAILRVTYEVNNGSTTKTVTVYHVLRFNKKDENSSDPDSPPVLYPIVRNNTYYINCKKLNPDVAFYNTLKEAIDGQEFVNADVEVDRAIPDISNEQYTLQIKLKNEGTSVVFNTEGEHELHFVYRLVSDVNTPGSIEPDDFNVYWEKSQGFCNDDLELSYNTTTKQFTITATVLQGKLTDHLQDQWIVIENKNSHLKRYIHVYAIDQFRYVLNPTLKATGSNYVLSFQLPPTKHTLRPEDEGYADELIYPETLYPIDVKFTTNTLNAYNIQQTGTNYGLFGVAVEGTQKLTNAANFETGYNDPISSTSTDYMSHWYFQQEDNFWDFWYTYSLKTYPEDGVVNIYFTDVRNHIKYTTVEDVGLFLYVEYFGKNYSIKP